MGAVDHRESEIFAHDSARHKSWRGWNIFLAVTYSQVSEQRARPSNPHACVAGHVGRGTFIWRWLDYPKHFGAQRG